MALGQGPGPLPMDPVEERPDRAVLHRRSCLWGGILAHKHDGVAVISMM